MVRKVIVLIFRDDKGRVLLQHRTDDAPTHPGYWGFFGGRVKDNETLEQGLQRETQEELQIQVKDFKFFKTYRQLEPDEEQDRVVFIAPLIHSVDELREKQREGQNLGLFSFEELKNLKISENNMIILKDVFKV
jgi:8-oxo-dGTP pyrophosphatase MutT (NUDIX family)